LVNAVPSGLLRMPGACWSVDHRPAYIMNTGRSANRISGIPLYCLIFAFVQGRNNLRHFMNPLPRDFPDIAKLIGESVPAVPPQQLRERLLSRASRSPGSREFFSSKVGC